MCIRDRNYYLSTISSEQLAKVDILKDMLLFRDNPSRCIGLFVNDKISTAINCICTEWLSDSSIFYMCYSSYTIIIIIIILPMCVSFFIFFMLYLVYDLNNNLIIIIITRSRWCFWSDNATAVDAHLHSIVNTNKPRLIIGLTANDFNSITDKSITSSDRQPQ